MLSRRSFLSLGIGIGTAVLSLSRATIALAGGRERLVSPSLIVMREYSPKRTATAIYAVAANSFSTSELGPERICSAGESQPGQDLGAKLRSYFLSLLNANNTNTVPSYGSDPVPGARLYVYSAGTDSLCPIFKDSGLTVTLPNPLIANSLGEFDLCYLMDGTYRVTISKPNGEIILVQDEILCRSQDNQNVTAGFADVSDLLSDKTMSYTVATGRSLVREGDLIHVQLNKFSYRVANQTVQDHHLTSEGGIKFYVVRKRDAPLHFAAFGPAADGTTDDLELLNTAVAAADGETLDLGNLNIAIAGSIDIPAAGLRLRGDRAKIICKTADFSVLVPAVSIEIEGIDIESANTFIELDGSAPKAIPRIRLRDVTMTGCNYPARSVVKDGVTISELIVMDCKVTGGYSGLSFDCNVASAWFVRNSVTAVSLPSSGTEPGVDCIAFGAGHHQSETSKLIWATQNYVDGLFCQQDGKVCNGVRFFAESVHVFNNTFMNIDTLDSAFDDCEGIYAYADKHVIHDNILVNAGRNQGAIAVKGKEIGFAGVGFEGKYSIIHSNIVYFEDNFADHAPGILVSCSHVKVYGNNIVNAGCKDGARGHFGAIHTDRGKTLNGIEIRDNTIQCRGTVGILLRHNGNNCHIRDNKIHVTGEMDPTMSADWFGILYHSEGEEHRTLDGWLVRDNDVSVAANPAKRSVGFGMTKNYGGILSTFTNLRIAGNIWSGEEAYYMSPSSQFALDGITFEGNNYAETLAAYSAVFATIAGKIRFVNEHGITVTTNDGSTTNLVRIKMPRNGCLGGTVSVRGVAGSDIYQQQYEMACSDVNGVAQKIGETASPALGSAGAQTWATAVDVNGSEMRLRITGNASTTIGWEATIRDLAGGV